MKTFRYTAYVSYARKVEGTIDAINSVVAAEKIRRRHSYDRLHNLKIEEIVK